MAEQNKDILKRANRLFITKVLVNLLLLVAGSLIIYTLLRRVQDQTALSKQRTNSEKALTEAVGTLEENEKNAEDLTSIFHDSNQDMLDDLNKLLVSGLFSSLTTADNDARSEVMQDIVARSGVDYLFLMSEDGRVLMSPYADYYHADLVALDLLSSENLSILLRGTRNEDGSVTPAAEKTDRTNLYFYSLQSSYAGHSFYLVLGMDASILDDQVSALRDMSDILHRAAVGNGGFLFAVDGSSDNFLYYRNGAVILTGTSAQEAGLTKEALKDGYTGVQTIKGKNYQCVTKSFGDAAIICAVEENTRFLTNDRHVVLWSILGFVLVMLLCLTYAVIVRNDFVRNSVETEKRVFMRAGREDLIIDISILKKVLPLMGAGVIMIFGISFYTQTLLEVSSCIEDSATALEEVTVRYNDSLVTRELIQNYYNNRFLAKARLIAYLFEEDPSVLNEETDRYYSVFDEEGNRSYVKDDEGNNLRTVGLSRTLEEMCRSNDIDSIYIFDEDGRTIATNTENWFFTVSHNEEDQSYPFLQVLDGKKDHLVQESMVSDVGIQSQYFGVIFHYYTAKDKEGNTVYLSHFDHRILDEQLEVKDRDLSAYGQITPHRGMLQVGLNEELSEKLLASTDVSAILSSNMLSGGFIVLFDNSSDPVCLYSPYSSSIGKTASEMGVSANAFSGSDYYGFLRVNGTEYFQYFRYQDNYFIGTAIPRANMYQSRLSIALLTALISLALIFLLSAAVSVTSSDEEELYRTLGEDKENSGWNAAIFSIILPSGVRTSTVKAAARWDNRHIPWSERSPEQKLITMLTLVGEFLILYVLLTVFTSVRFFSDSSSVIPYIISGNWDRSLNVFALSACALVMISAMVIIALLRLPIRISSSLLGARGETISHLLLSVLKYGGTLGAMFYCLYLLGMDSHNLLASAGVLSLIIGLGAQSLIKDILAGIFIVFEGEFRVGDIVTIGGYRGTVMDIGLRTTKIMGPEGNIKIYNNSEISGILNMTKEASFSWCIISIEYGQDIDYVEAVLKRELPNLAKENPQILEGPDYYGVQNLGESGVDLMVACKCFEQDIKAVTRYLNREVLKIFYRNGINVPFPNVTVSQLDTSGRRTIADLPEEDPTA